MAPILALKKKICLLGPFAVGKTSLVEQFVHSRFDDKYLTTVGVKISQKLLAPFEVEGTGQMVQSTLLIWDIAGMERFDPMVANYYRGAAGAIAVADLTRPETVPLLETICEKFKSVNPTARMLLVGNKQDLFKGTGEPLGALQKLAAALQATYMLTSAKTGEQVEAAFNTLAREMEGA